MNARRFIQRLAVTIQAVTIVLSLGGCAAPTLQVAAAPAAPASAPAAPASAPASRQDGGTLSSSLERCEQPLGSLSLREDENSSWFVQLRSKQLGSTLPMLRRLIEQSNCFVVIERDRIPADRALAGGPGTLGMGPKQAADFTLSPSVQFASTGRSWVPGFFGGGFGALAGGLASADASTTLLLVDNRSGVQVAAAESSSHRADLDQNGLDNRVLAAAGSDYGRTIEGKVVLAAFADSYNKTVKSLRRYQETMLQGRLSTGMQVNAGLTAEPLRPYVNFDAPRSTRAAQKVAVQIWLSRRGETPEARVQAQGSQQPDPQGRLELRLPRDRRNWTIRVVMIAPGFDFEPGSSNVATLQLTDEQTSDTAGFFLLARDDQVGEQSLRATLWHEGAYLGSVTRDIRIEAVAKDVGRSTTNVPGAASGIAGLAPGGPASTVGRALLAPPNSAPADPALDAQRGELPAPRPTSADLTVYVRHENPLALGRVAVIVSSPHLQGPPTTESYQYPSDTARWLAAWIDRLQRLHATRDAQAAARNVDMLRGLGVELYQRLAPPRFKSALASVLKARPATVLTIQVHSNNSTIPWELMRPGLIAGRDVDFLGTDFRMARWPVDNSERTPEVPRQSILLREIVVIAPRYAGDQRLQAQAEEVSFLSGLRGFRLAAGTSDGMRQVAANPPAGIVHFAGHGEATGATPEQRRFLLRLEDSRFDAVAWRGVRRAATPTGSLYFFNACELGATESQAGAVAGWAPALLDSGASGFIGGLWSLPDGPASRFAMRFYGALGSSEATAPRRGVTEALRQARALFFETGDPAFLAYAYYGDVNLEMLPPP